MDSSVDSLRSTPSAQNNAESRRSSGVVSACGNPKEGGGGAYYDISNVALM